MKRFLAACLIATVGLAACETTPTIRANTDPSANLAGYKTYAFAADLGTTRAGYSTPITGYFKEAIRREMDSRGYSFLEGSTADLLVNFNTSAHENVDLQSTPGPTMGMGYYGYRGGMYGGLSVSSPEVETVRYKVGTANVDLVDAGKKQLVWEGVAEGRLTDKMMKDPRTAINAIVTEMFAKYPGRAAP